MCMCEICPWGILCKGFRLFPCPDEKEEKE